VSVKHNKTFIVFIIVLGQHVSILIESSSGPSKIQILTEQCLKCTVGSQMLTFLIKLCTKVLEIDIRTVQ